MKSIAILSIASTIIVAAAPVIAKNEGKWPKNAVDLTESETVALFSGHTINFTRAQYYFDPNGSIVGYNKGKNGESFATGTWEVKGNEFCLHSSWKGKNKSAAPYPFTWCNKLKKANKVIWAQNTQPEDKYLYDIYDKISKKLKKGDLVSKKVASLKAKYGY